MSVRVLHGDMLAVLPTLEAESISAVVTDPPYELGFMGKSWDKSGIAFSVETWRQVLRVMKPGAHLAAFGAPRNSHRMTCAIEDAGFEIRDSIARLHDGGLDGPLLWAFGSGFPKSHDISKAIDKAAGAVREVVGTKLGQPGYSLANSGRTNEIYGDLHNPAAECAITAPATPEAAQWAGWGSALKPAYEPILLARKPLSGTLAANTLRHGVGGINIDACRIASGPDHAAKCASVVGLASNRNGACYGEWKGERSDSHNTAGRWPANVLHDGSDEVMAAFAAFGDRRSAGDYPSDSAGTGKGVTYLPKKKQGALYDDTGSAARFFFCGKADADDRAGSKHPTVKPLSLMTWLVRLITPPGGTVLDPFAGSGTTLLAADRLQLDAIGIEQLAEYVADIHHRLRSDAPLFADAAQ